jgi:hypothetical protein
MAPGLDFFNHRPDGETPVLPKGRGGIPAGVVATRAYQRGEQIFLSYGANSNANLLVTYGFAMQHNPEDKVPMILAVSFSDPAVQKRAEDLRRGCWLDARGVPSDALVETLDLACAQHDAEPRACRWHSFVRGGGGWGPRFVL